MTKRCGADNGCRELADNVEAFLNTGLLEWFDKWVGQPDALTIWPFTRRPDVTRFFEWIAHHAVSDTASFLAWLGESDDFSGNLYERLKRVSTAQPRKKIVPHLLLDWALQYSRAAARVTVPANATCENMTLPTEWASRYACHWVRIPLGAIIGDRYRKKVRSIEVVGRLLPRSGQRWQPIIEAHLPLTMTEETSRTEGHVSVSAAIDGSLKISARAGTEGPAGHGGVDASSSSSFDVQRSITKTIERSTAKAVIQGTSAGTTFGWKFAPSDRKKNPDSPGGHTDLILMFKRPIEAVDRAESVLAVVNIRGRVQYGLPTADAFAWPRIVELRFLPDSPESD